MTFQIRTSLPPTLLADARQALIDTFSARDGYAGFRRRLAQTPALRAAWCWNSSKISSAACMESICISKAL